MGFAGRAGLLDPSCLEVLQVDESFSRRHGFWNGADFAHERQHAVEGANVDLALARQNVERGHDAVGAARDRNHDKIDAFAGQSSFTVHPSRRFCADLREIAIKQKPDQARREQVPRMLVAVDISNL
jgi:hypothetical protein